MNSRILLDLGLDPILNSHSPFRVNIGSLSHVIAYPIVFMYDVQGVLFQNYFFQNGF